MQKTQHNRGKKVVSITHIDPTHSNAEKGTQEHSSASFEVREMARGDMRMSTTTLKLK
jgi:hypothetical protein